MVLACAIALSVLSASCGSRTTPSSDATIPPGDVPFPDVSGDATPDAPQMDAAAGPNTTCVDAAPLVLQGGKVSVKGTTAHVTNEYQDKVRCGLTDGALNGPQRYYKLVLRAGQTYLVSVEAEYRFAYFYVAPGCGAAVIDAACRSGGASGDVERVLYRSLVRHYWRTPGFPRPAQYNGGWLVFTPKETGVYIVGVDGLLDHYGGTFRLEVAEVTPPANDRCAAAQPLKLAKGGSISVKGSVAGAANEFGDKVNPCGHKPRGPQVYYKLSLTGGRTYRVALSQATGLVAYAFAAPCSASSINKQCKQAAVAPSAAWAGGSMVLAPKTDGVYIIAVDDLGSAIPAASRPDFTLEIADVTDTDKDSCSGATLLKLVNGRAVASGSHAGAVNEFGSAVTCGLKSALVTPQVYYSALLEAGKTYRVRVAEAEGFYAYQLYAFNGGCTPAAIDASCSKPGHYAYTSMSMPMSLLVTPAKTEPYVFAVERVFQSFQVPGDFTIELEEVHQPHASCASARALTLNGGEVVVDDDTTGAPDEQGQQIDCGLSWPLIGPQLHYQLQLKQGTVYRFELSGCYMLARPYVFGASCSPKAIDQSCKVGGKSGTYTNDARLIFFTPTVTAAHHVAVDSRLAPMNIGAQGPFRLKISELGAVASTCAGAPSTTTLKPGRNLFHGDGRMAGAASVMCQAKTFATLAHYRFWLEANKTYTFALESNYAGPLIMFRDRCGTTEISADCSSLGVDGDFAVGFKDTLHSALQRTPSTSGWYRVAVGGSHGAGIWAPYDLEVFVD